MDIVGTTTADVLQDRMSQESMFRQSLKSGAEIIRLTSDGPSVITLTTYYDV